jgi:hypothetical protein
MGFDARKLSSLRMIPRFLSDRARFLAAGGRIDRHMPVLTDYADQAGAARGHYFHQDLLVATMIHRAAPRRHIDVGSRIDGFVAHVAAFRDIEVIDIRPLKIDHPRIAFLQHDILKLPQELRGAADSVSCLHALEHFGLGRYGDTIDPDAHLKGFSALGDLLEVGGTLYMGLPIGRSGVYFNAHRVFSPSDLLTWSKENFELNRFDYVDDAGDLHCEARVDNTPPLDYGCGIYTMTKIA